MYFMLICDEWLLGCRLAFIKPFGVNLLIK